MIDTGSPAPVGRLSTHGPGEVDGAQWQHHRFLQVHSHLCQLLLHLLRIQPLLHGVSVCWKHERVEGPCISPLVSPREGAMVTAHTHGRSMGISTGITGQGWTQRFWVCGHLYWCHRVEMDPRVGGLWIPPLMSLLALTSGAHRLRDAAGVTEPVGIDRPHQEQVDSVRDKAGHCVGLTLHISCHCLPRATRCLAARGQG